MSKNDTALQFVGTLKSHHRIYDDKKGNCYIEDKSKYSDSSFYRAIGEQDTNMYLNELFLKKFSDLMTDAALKKVNAMLVHETKTRGEKYNINFRVAKLDDKIYINAGNGKVIKITSQEVIKVKTNKVKFEIHDSIGCIANPDLDNGDIDLLKKYIPVGQADFKLILVFIFNAFFTDTHYLLLALIGPAGSAKSFIQKVIKTVIDPSPIMLRNQFKQDEDLVIAAEHCHVIDMNNVSTLSKSIQDTLCTILTSGVASGRKKFTDKSESAIHTHNPVILNGIGNIVTRDDLYERSIVINLKKLKDTNIKPISEKKLTEDFNNDLPKIIGGIYNALSFILEEYETFETPGELNRMADFHVLGCVTEKALGWKVGSFTKAYNANIANAQGDVLDGSPVAQAIVKMMKHVETNFQGTYIKLKESLSCYGDIGNIDPRKLSAEIDRISDSLRNIHGIEITKLPRSNSGSRLKICMI
ncbi:MAG: hypothetical protein Q8N96_15095 [Methylovulum sp.]|nr:hypothetical protein [Methylovulum sp.]